MKDMEQLEEISDLIAGLPAEDMDGKAVVFLYGENGRQKGCVRGAGDQILASLIYSMLKEVEFAELVVAAAESYAIFDKTKKRIVRSQKNVRGS